MCLEAVSRSRSRSSSIAVHALSSVVTARRARVLVALMSSALRRQSVRRLRRARALSARRRQSSVGLRSHRNRLYAHT